MKELDQLFSYCGGQYVSIICNTCPLNNNCHNVYMKPKCTGCLYEVHRHYNNSLHYPCEKSLYLYVLKFQARYASEIDRALWLLMHGNVNNSIPLTMYSIGCGPASECFGFIQSLRRFGFSDALINYRGFDLDSRWRNIDTEVSSLFGGVNISFNYTDAFQYIDNHPNESITFLTMNYMLSDVMRYDNKVGISIMDKVYDYIVNRRIGVFIMNDVFLFYNGTAYTCIEYLKKKLKVNKVKFTALELRYSAMKTTTVPPFGTIIKQNTLTFSVPSNIQNKYYPFMLCNSMTSMIYLTA